MVPLETASGLTANDADPARAAEQRDYLQKTLQKVDFILHFQTRLSRGPSFTAIIEDFDSMKLKAGLYNWPGNEIHSRPYIKFIRPWPDGKAHLVQMGPIDEQ